MRAKKKEKVDWAKNIFNSLCSELDWWYKYVKENKGNKKYTYQFALVLVKIFQYLFVHQKENPQKPRTKVKRIREELQTTSKNKKKVAPKSPISAFKRKNKIEEGGVSCSRVKKE
jgi:meiotically up-regulated gene 157 (Mug157) protein